VPKIDGEVLIGAVIRAKRTLNCVSVNYQKHLMLMLNLVRAKGVSLSVGVIKHKIVMKVRYNGSGCSFF
jgi:hypothetical protein